MMAAPLAPVSANFFWKQPDFSGPPVRGDEPGVSAAPLPGATPAELRAMVVWNLRSALNVAALQCQFDPTLLTRNQYNHMLDNHKAELAAAYQTLSGYFTRRHKKAGASHLDAYGTRTYSSFSAVGLPQFNFCATAARIGREALFARRGQLHLVAEQRLTTLRNSLTRRLAEQQFTYAPPYFTPLPVPLEEACRKKGRNGRCRT
ncbi:hypothetical protein GVO57_00450 [Sphingomonas changnyeongensis]|uniref:Uncharacterized protein n=1 Tax=Sphingomonas changnyeongensis TaxID=2698679 RepID=A0A7Z2NUA5_9SPHN|nr:hypothetical protein [Sphingomonas changnyeongensis]QHL89576.1 hypothetical protein GVO57_00450 [Sphingomonas changnyeongensis]